ncbi:MAG: TIGR03546 family protein [Candidatus Marinimicrobia bacterium]|nr:TIGR03546 family protein [Candidatus Neomarinimicrobiota bacterium]
MKLIKKLLKALKSASSPSQLAWGFALGMIMILGLTPFWNIHNAIIFILILIININIGSAILGFLIFSGFAYIFDPLFHALGYYLLTQVEFLQGLWQSLYNNPAVVATQYNNTVVLGSLLSAVIIFIPVFFGFKKFVHIYREKIDPYIQKLKIVKVLKSTKLYKLFSTGYELKNIGD